MSAGVVRCTPPHPHGLCVGGDRVLAARCLVLAWCLLHACVAFHVVSHVVALVAWSVLYFVLVPCVLCRRPVRWRALLFSCLFILSG